MEVIIKNCRKQFMAELIHEKKQNIGKTDNVTEGRK